MNVMLNDTNDLDKFLSLFVVVCLFLSLLTQIRGHIVFDYSTYNSADIFAIWGITEWLISYEGGLVRRGLTGELIYIVASILNIPPNVIIVLSCVLIYFILIMLVVNFCKNKYPIYFICSPLLLGGPAFSGFIIRKDVLLILLFTISLYIVVSNLKFVIKYIIVNILCVISIFTHEMFVFIGFPLLIYIHSLYNKIKIYSFNTIAFYFISFISIIFIVFYRGNIEIVLTMIESWNYLNMKIAPLYCCFKEPEAAFLALYDFDWHVSINLLHWRSFVYGIIWVPGFWVCIWFVCAIFMTKFIKLYDFGKEKIFLELYLFQSVFALPLFIIAWDYGRWILSIVIMSFIAMIILYDKVCLPFQNRIHTNFVQKKSMYFWQKIIIVLMFGVPHVLLSIEYMFRAMPLVDLVYFFVDW